MSMFTINGGFTGLAASSRVRLARNIKGYPFRLTEAQHKEIADKAVSYTHLSLVGWKLFLVKYLSLSR